MNNQYKPKPNDFSFCTNQMKNICHDYYEDNNHLITLDETYYYDFQKTVYSVSDLFSDDIDREFSDLFSAKEYFNSILNLVSAD